MSSMNAAAPGTAPIFDALEDDEAPKRAELDPRFFTPRPGDVAERSALRPSDGARRFYFRSAGPADADRAPVLSPDDPRLWPPRRPAAGDLFTTVPALRRSRTYSDRNDGRIPAGRPRSYYQK